MFTNRFSQIIIVVLLLALALATVSFVAYSPHSLADRSYDNIEQIRAERPSFISVTGRYDDRYDRMNTKPYADQSYKQIEALRLQR